VEPVQFNPFDPEFRRDPVPTYTRLREEDPTHRSPLGFWVLSRHADCMAMLHHQRSSSDARNSSAFAAFAGEMSEQDAAELEQMRRLRPFLFMDPPDHTRLRGLVAKAFTPRVVEQLRPRVVELVDELLDRVAERGHIELIEDLAYPLPVRVISEMLGVPSEDHETFKGWSGELARSLDPEALVPAEVLERRQQAVLSFHGYFRGLIAERRVRPQDDLLTALIAAEDEGHRLAEEELLSTCVLLLVAGHETTVNLIGNGMLALLRHPNQLRRLRDDPSVARAAVEELLRFDPPVTLTGRVAIEDIEVGGITVEAGEMAVLLLGAANRDPAEFKDPDRLDLTRPDNHHAAFGHGIHFCLGAPLARLEGQVAFMALAERLKDLELATDEPEYKENIVLRGLAALPLRFTAAAKAASQ